MKVSIEFRRVILKRQADIHRKLDKIEMISGLHSFIVHKTSEPVLRTIYLNIELRLYNENTGSIIENIKRIDLNEFQ